MKEIKVIIGKDGQFTMESHGIKGTGCLKELEKTVKSMDGKIKEKKPTKDFYEHETGVLRDAR